MAQREYLRGFSEALTFGANADLKQVTNEDCLATDIISILDEKQGEWFLNPTHGTTLDQELFSPNDEILKAQIKSKLVSEVSIQEPRVTFGNVSIRSGAEDPERVGFANRAEAESMVLVLVPFQSKITAEDKVLQLEIEREG